MQSTYIPAVRDLLNDPQGSFFQDDRVIANINNARFRVAASSGCIRVLPPSGTGQNQTVANQEVYPFSGITALVQAVPGVSAPLAVRSVAVAIGVGGWKPVWMRVPWTDFQARFRVYNGTFMGTISEPGWWAQYSQGAGGSIFLAPIPTQANPMDWDVSCLPLPLAQDTDPEAIPVPWTDAVPYWAAVLLLLKQQRTDDAKAMAMLFNADLPWAASVVCPQFISNAYGAMTRSA